MDVVLPFFFAFGAAATSVMQGFTITRSRRALREPSNAAVTFGDHSLTAGLAVTALLQLLTGVSNLTGRRADHLTFSLTVGAYLFLAVGAVMHYRTALWNEKSPRAKRAAELLAAQAEE